jgi:hypothetical protein
MPGKRKPTAGEGEGPSRLREEGYLSRVFRVVQEKPGSWPAPCREGGERDKKHDQKGTGCTGTVRLDKPLQGPGFEGPSKESSGREFAGGQGIRPE